MLNVCGCVALGEGYEAGRKLGDGTNRAEERRHSNSVRPPACGFAAAGDRIAGGRATRQFGVIRVAAIVPVTSTGVGVPSRFHILNVNLPLYDMPSAATSMSSSRVKMLVAVAVGVLGLKSQPT